MSIAVFGSTGHLGALAVESLLGRGVAASDIRAIGRNEERLAALSSRGIDARRADLDDPAALATALDGVENVLLISGGDVGARVAQHGNAISAATDAGVSRIVYTSAPRATTTALVLAPDHKATEEAITASGLTHTILRNGWYTENYLQDFERARATGEIASSIAGGRIASAPRADFAEAAAVVLTGSGHENRVYELSGDVAWTFAEFAEAASVVLGRPVTYRPLGPDEEAEVLRAAGLDEGTIGFVVALNGNIRDGLVGETSGDLARLIGHPTEPLIDTMRRWA